MPIQDLWYRNAVIYCLAVEKYMDANGDGVGDFEGLARRLDYLSGLGVNCVWLQPFYTSPDRDNGYDVSDYYGVDRRYGSLGDFVEFMNHARSLGIRVILDLVVNHTSDQHPWFQAARKDPRSSFRDWYVWSSTRPKDHAKGLVFPGVQKTNWTRDPVARKFYFHRFYEFQPDLDTAHPAVREEISRIMGYWLELGASGFRIDAVPFLVSRKGAGVRPQADFGMLHEMRNLLQWRCRDAILLAEANVVPEESIDYFGERGDRLQMMLNFPVNQRLFYALAAEDVRPLVWALEQTAVRPPDTQWVQFLRSHDELDLGRLTDEQRQRVFQAFGPQKSMQLYGRGIRRRLAPMMGDPARLRLALNLLFALPGTPLIQFGDELGLGDNLDLDEREAARTPMQWTAEAQGGFTRSKRPVAPVNSDAVFGYQHVNAADQRRDPQSLLNWMERLIRMRKECPEIGWGQVEVLDAPRQVLALRHDWRGTSLVTVHNLSRSSQRVTLDVKVPRGGLLVDVFDHHHSRAGSDGCHDLRLGGWSHRWFRVGGPDNALQRSER